MVPPSGCFRWFYLLSFEREVEVLFQVVLALASTLILCWVQRKDGGRGKMDEGEDG